MVAAARADRVNRGDFWFDFGDLSEHEEDEEVEARAESKAAVNSAVTQEAAKAEEVRPGPPAVPAERKQPAGKGPTALEEERQRRTAAEQQQQQQQHGLQQQEDWSDPPLEGPLPPGPVDDGPSPRLAAFLAPLRERLALRVARRLEDYDRHPSASRPMDAQHKCRDGFQQHLLSENLKELREALVAQLRSGPSPGQVWKALEGLRVHAAPDPCSEALPSQLGAGAWLEEEELVGDWLRYQLVRGSGPEVGWVSVIGDGRVLVERVCNVPRSLVTAGRERYRASPELLAKVSSNEQVAACEEPPPLAVLGLMAAHVKSAARLERLRHALESVRLQDVSRAEADFVFAVSWFCLEEGLAKKAAEVLGAFIAAPGAGRRLAVRQEKARSQFQHIGAALTAAEEALRRRHPEAKRLSVWVVFGDDDDIWHSGRVSQYVAAIKAHPVQEGVAIFATMVRANLAGWKKFELESMPQTEAEVDALFEKRQCKRMDQEESCQQWKHALREAGSRAPLLPVKAGLPLEYFDLCPRARVLREFLRGTEASILAHRYCDLCFDEWVSAYPCRGREAGLELFFFWPQRPECWMYFYAHAGMSNFQLSLSLEMPGDMPVAYVGSDEGGHVSTKVDVLPSDVQHADAATSALRGFIPGLTLPRVSRYLAAYRNHLECYLVRVHRRKIDQRMLDYHVNEAYKASFEGLKREVSQLQRPQRVQVKGLIYRLLEAYAKELAAALAVDVLWLDPEKPLPIPGDDDEGGLGLTSWDSAPGGRR